MITRREFLDALAVGAAGLAVGTTAKSYGADCGRQRPPELCCDWVKRAWLCAPLVAEGEQKRRAHFACVRCGQQHSEEVR